MTDTDSLSPKATARPGGERGAFSSTRREVAADQVPLAQEQAQHRLRLGDPDPGRLAVELVPLEHVADAVGELRRSGGLELGDEGVALDVPRQTRTARDDDVGVAADLEHPGAATLGEIAEIDLSHDRSRIGRWNPDLPSRKRSLV